MPKFLAVKKIPAAILILSFTLFCRISLLHAASIDQVYGALLPKGDALFTETGSFFSLREISHHGLAAYEKAEARVGYTTFDTSLKFSPVDNCELNLGINQAYPADYTRDTYNPKGYLSVIQDYELNNLGDYYLQVRLREQPFQPYLSVLEKSQKDSWHSSSYLQAPDYFAYIRTHYSDRTFGLLYLSSKKGETTPPSGLSILTRPLLDPGQLNINGLLRYRKGSLRRNSYYYFNNLLSVSYNMYHHLQHQYNPQVIFGYGLNKMLELESGLSFSLPYKYYYEYRSFTTSGLTNLKSSYKTDREFNIPIRLSLRPQDNFEVFFSSDTSYCRQRLDYRRIETTGAVTTYDSRKLNFFSTQPSLILTYLFERGKDIKEDAFASFTKKLLSAGQFLVKLTYRKDITILDKSDKNGPQNRIDPYNAFIYPLDYFVAGTEQAAFFTGNYSGSATNVAAQNYNFLKFDFLYGVTDCFNIGATIGYRSASRFHNFTVGGSSTYDLKTRAYVLKPYWFFGVPCDWRIGKNTLVSLSWIYTPHYQTFLRMDGLPKEFKSKTDYHSASLSIRILF